MKVQLFKTYPKQQRSWWNHGLRVVLAKSQGFGILDSLAMMGVASVSILALGTSLSSTLNVNRSLQQQTAYHAVLSSIKAAISVNEGCKEGFLENLEFRPQGGKIDKFQTGSQFNATNFRLKMIGASGQTIFQEGMILENGLLKAKSFKFINHGNVGATHFASLEVVVSKLAPYVGAEDYPEHRFRLVLDTVNVPGPNRKITACRGTYSNQMTKVELSILNWYSPPTVTLDFCLDAFMEPTKPHLWHEVTSACSRWCRQSCDQDAVDADECEDVNFPPGPETNFTDGYAKECGGGGTRPHCVCIE